MDRWTDGQTNAQWVESVRNRRIHFIVKNLFPTSLEVELSEQASKRVSAAEGASEASSPEQANE